MAKAGGKATTDWIWLADAVRYVTAAVVGWRARAENLLLRWLATGELPWIAMSWTPSQKYVDSVEEGKPSIAPDDRFSNGDPAFFRFPLEINWDESKARQSSVPWPLGASAIGIKVPGERVLDILLAGGAVRNYGPGAAEWIAAEAKRMKEAGEIPGVKTDFARELARRMANAAKRDRSLRAIQWESIRNQLETWGLWPAALIK